MKELTEVLKDWEAVIGLEIHTELTALDTKMFCGCKLSHTDEPNANVCPVCLGLPGALPVPNERAIESIVCAGLATNCQIQKRSMFYRKHLILCNESQYFHAVLRELSRFYIPGHLRLQNPFYGNYVLQVSSYSLHYLFLLCWYLRKDLFILIANKLPAIRFSNSLLCLFSYFYNFRFTHCVRFFNQSR